MRPGGIGRMERPDMSDKPKSDYYAAPQAGDFTQADEPFDLFEAWFEDAGGGLETMGYLGSNSDMGPMMIAEDETVSVGVRADSQVIRDTLKGYALMSLIVDGALAGQVTEQADLAAAAATQLLAADGDITDVRARIGAVEARIEDAQARNAAEKSAYELARTELVGADPYQTATELQAVYAQIETLYTVTARIAGLKFTDYMR